MYVFQGNAATKRIWKKKKLKQNTRKTMHGSRLNDEIVVMNYCKFLLIQEANIIEKKRENEIKYINLSPPLSHAEIFVKTNKKNQPASQMRIIRISHTYAAVATRK